MLPAEGTLADGMRIIADFVRTLPKKPGVYRMIGADGEVLYVGKARVAAQPRRRLHPADPARDPAACAWCRHTRSMEFVVTDSEAEALLLENNLIKRFRPRFNVLLRDDKSFPYIVIRRDTEWPQLAKHRGARQPGNEYFGPFASATAVNRTLYALQRAFLLRSCSDGVFSSRTRPCLQYQIKRCTAPCVGRIDKPEYDALVERGARLPRRHAIARSSRRCRDAHGDGQRPSCEFEQRRRAARPHPRAGPYPVAPVDQPAGDRRGRHLRRPCRRRPGLRPGVLLPRRPESRQPRLFPEPRQGTRRRPRSWPPSSASSTRARPRAEADPDQPRRRPSASCWQSALAIAAGHKVEIRTPKRGDKKDAGRPGA